MKEYIEELKKAAPQPAKRYESSDGVMFTTMTNSDLGENCIWYALPKENEDSTRTHNVILKRKLLSVVGEANLRSIFGGDFDIVFDDS